VSAEAEPGKQEGSDPNATREEVPMGEGTGDKMEGKKDELKGRAKEALGKATNDSSTTAEGKKDQVKGAGKQAWGDAKNAGERVKDALS
jgi:uncharacterized protein YjbJ (UPF0337 family)